MIRPRQITSGWLARQCDSGAWRRGSRYFRNRAATLEQAEPLDEGGLLLTGTCTGSMPQPYVQHIEIRDGDGSLTLVGQCSCPVGRNCKHVVAQILTWQATAAYSDEDPDAVSDWLNQMPDESRGGGNKRPSIRYLLNFHDSYEIRLAFEITRPLKDGRTGKPRRLSSMPTASPQVRPEWMDDIDAEIIALANACRLETGRVGVALTGSLGALTLDKIISTGRAFEDSADPERESPLRAGPSRRMEIEWKRTKSGYQAHVLMESDTAELPLDPPRYIDSRACLVGPLELPKGVGHDMLDWLRGSPVIPEERAAALSRRLARTLPSLPTPVKVEIVTIDQPPAPCLAVHFQPANPRMAWAQLSFDYDGVELAPELGRDEVVTEADERLVRVRRHPDFEQEAMERLLDTGMRPARGEPGRVRLDVDDDLHSADAWFHWLEAAAPDLEAEGWRITQPGGDEYSLEHAQGLEGEIEDRNNDWFDLRFDLELEDGRRAPFLPLVTGLLRRYSPGSMPETVYLSLGRDQYVAIPSRQIEPVLETILELYDGERPDHLRLARPDSPRLLDLGKTPIRGATQVRALAKTLRDFKGVDPVKLPTTFKGELRPYQQHGVEWIQFLRKHGLAGILADDMGLGKTVQTLAHLSVEKRAGRMTLPSLIVAPTSLMGNWRREAELFTPGLNLLVLHGSERGRHFDDLDDYDVVLTTYPLLPRDREVLLEKNWHYVILDEAQQIKNPRAQAAQVSRALKARHRLCLTGTPMENHLGELWAQFDFLMPGFLGSREDFNRHYRTPIEKHRDRECLDRLRRRIAPFLLRRAKDQVASELPPKTEIIRAAAFEPKQARLYESIRLTMESKVRQAINDRGLARSHIVVLDALLKLRQVCCDPRLLKAERDNKTGGKRPPASAKFEMLFELLPELLDEGRRILLFSQFTSMLALIEEEVRKRGIQYTKLTGQTRNRDDAIEDFRQGEANLFLISLKAGGVGLNLVEADTVIHYDPWWNPAVETQATDRAHRIGQDKPVFVYKLITEGTVEERILALQERKHQLASDIYAKDRAPDAPPIDEQTIRELLGSAA